MLIHKTHPPQADIFLKVLSVASVSNISCDHLLVIPHIPTPVLFLILDDEGSVKSRAWRACFLACFMCSRTCVLTCLMLGAFACLTCLRAWRAYVFASFVCLLVVCPLFYTLIINYFPRKIPS